jgi:hypothetical protein
MELAWFLVLRLEGAPHTLGRLSKTAHSARKSEASILHFAHRGAPMFAHAIMTTFELLARLPTRKAAAA